MKEKKRQIVGMDAFQDPRLNKGTAFTEQERDALKLRGLPGLVTLWS